jgi:Kef-type K+ transport system membrane component KefB
MPPLICALAGAAAMATSPAIVLSLSREARARGQVTDRIAFLTALDCVYAFIAVGMLFALLHADYGHGWLSTVAHPLYLVFVSLGLALLLAGVALLVLKRLHGHPDAQRVSALAFVLIGVALADWMNLPPVLVTLVFGMRLASLVRDRQIGALDFGPLGYVLVVLLFVLQAASLDLSLFIGGLLAGLGVVVARQAGKIVGVLLTARMSGLSGRRGLLVGLGLGPMSVVTLMLVQETVREFPERGAVLAGFMVSALVVQEIVGTLLARFAIARAGETDQAVR